MAIDGDIDVPLIGSQGEEIEAFAFRGGGFNTVLALGVVHALLLLDRPQHPHIVSGISAGAVGAAAMADTLGQCDANGQFDRPRQAARLREFLTAYSQAPGELMESSFPGRVLVPHGRVAMSLQPAAPGRTSAAGAPGGGRRDGDPRDLRRLRENGDPPRDEFAMTRRP